jgi:hypothetical protein
MLNGVVPATRVLFHGVRFREMERMIASIAWRTDSGIEGQLATTSFKSSFVPTDDTPCPDATLDCEASCEAATLSLKPACCFP